MSKSKSSRSSINRRTFLRSAGVATAAAAATSLVRPGLAQEGDDPPPVRAMRSPRNNLIRATGSLPGLPPAGIIALNRMGFGPRPGDVSAFNALGGSDESRLAAYVDQQLDPGLDDSAFQTQLDSLGFQTLTKSLAQLWAEHQVADPPPEYGYSWRQLPLTDTMRATFNRAVHSRRQLIEVLADFWHNHFNVYGWDGNIAPVFVHYDREVIRKNLVGNFRTMLEDVAQSTAMLYFLDNRSNSGGKPNENYARELFELHTMGAENYMGEFPQEQVPVSNGRPIAYVDADVYGATTCFTGWTTNDNGLFEIDPNDHFPNQKVVFGVVIPANQTALKDGRDVLDMLASHPGTGRYICRKLCRRLISDNPPERIVTEAANLFTSQWQAPNQLEQVVRTILLSPEFRTTWGQKIKRPFEVTVSALRALNTNFWFNPDPPSGEDRAGSLIYTYNRMGQELFSWPAPTGYPDLKEDWSSMVPILQRWRLCHWMVDWEDSNVYHVGDAVARTPAGVRSPNALVSYWENRIFGRPMTGGDRQEIVEFIAQGRNPDYDLPIDTDGEVQHRLRSMVGLMFNSPDFQWR